MSDRRVHLPPPHDQPEPPSDDARPASEAPLSAVEASRANERLASLLDERAARIDALEAQLHSLEAQLAECAAQRDRERAAPHSPAPARAVATGSAQRVRAFLEETGRAIRSIVRARVARATRPTASTQPDEPRRAHPAYELVHASGILEATWYRAVHPELGPEVDPVEHYLSQGWALGWNPAPLFDARWYLAQNPDVRSAGANPLLHYLEFGASEGRKPHPLFDPAWYLETYADVARGGAEPLAHFIRFAASERRSPSPWFDSGFYLDANPDVAASGMNPLVHFLLHGAAEGRDPGPGFSTRHYLSTYADVAASGVNPLVHFVLLGAAEGRSPVEPQPPPPPRRDPSTDVPPAVALRLSAAADSSRLAARARVEALTRRSRISLLMPTFNSAPRHLRAALDSVLAQTYPDWELVAVDDGSTSTEPADVLREYARREQRVRVRVREENGGISRATNDALELARGDFVAMLDHDDELLPDALLEIATALDRSPQPDVVYTDQDCIGADGAIEEPLLKPDWSPTLFRGVMYVGHLLAVRRELALAVGGFDPGFDHVQDFEFMLRVSERTTRIAHVPKVLYHWRRIPGSVAFHGDEKAGIPALQAAAVSAHLRRIGSRSRAEPHPVHAHRAVLVAGERESWPRVTVVVRPGGDHAGNPAAAVAALQQRTAYPAAEFVGAAEGCPWPAPHSSDFVALVDGGLLPRSERWLQELLAHAEHEDCGLVAPLLVDTSGCVDDAGLVVGFDGALGLPMRGVPADADGYAGSLSCAREVSAVTGRCVVARAALLSRARPRPAYAAEIYRWADLSLRIRAEGRRNIVTPRAVFSTQGTRTASGDDAIDRALFLDVWGDFVRAGDPYYNPRFARAGAAYVVSPRATLSGSPLPPRPAER